ncbi:hypothetical protein EQZ23_06570 [Sphingomonas sp. UV9]|uniref:hypothetical protein n=1 Tax=Sphingomonas sp. UV9 TaxID=1851410 RepID=UPI000FFBFCA3|nr:hypothetical protein [Sphingomonas sp. UV9]RXD04811.1 hypothetical protein EQZ23_06570 [Sphingomonas sp. UV9]
MTAGMKQSLIVAAIGLLYWSAFTIASGAQEPWDGRYYWSAVYPLSMVLSAALGSIFRKHAWITGISLTLAQWPVMAINTGIGPLSLFAVAFLGVLSLPAILSAWVAS